MYYPVFPCIAMYPHVYHVVSCIAMYCYVLPYIAIYYHVLPCITMYCHCDTSETELSSTTDGQRNLPLNFKNSTMVHVQVSEVVEILELKKLI